LRRELRVNAGAAEEEKFAHPIIVGRANDVVLRLQIIEEKLDRKIVVCLNAAHFGCSQDDNLRLLRREKVGYVAGPEKVELSALALEQVNKTFGLESPDQGAPDETAVAGNKDFVRSIYHTEAAGAAGLRSD
jgi:hypothetical protein